MKKNEFPDGFPAPEELPEGVTPEDLLAEEEEPLVERVMRIVRRFVLIVATAAAYAQDAACLLDAYVAGIAVSTELADGILKAVYLGLQTLYLE